ncbi:hypothetical protein BMETH_1879_0 [methanotrophic bacterial endosymbiont of Bathymodiolus sp.]|nr:hypothetical protein BMETH_1879_0 [methanotrophic bacterial endosymbiont of Bathymodiolus sp.]
MNYRLLLILLSNASSSFLPKSLISSHSACSWLSSVNSSAVINL